MFAARRVLLGAGLLIVLTVLAGLYRHAGRLSPIGPSLVLPPDRAAAPQRRPNDYVGSRACAACHAAIAEMYAAHPMSHSAGVTPGHDDKENFAAGCEFELDDGRAYRVVKQADGIRHHELLRNKDGRPICDQSAKISFFFGSGARGKSYAVNRDGLLFQSPISWYTREGKWDTSPGYSHRGRSFSRRIEQGCVLCHAGRATSDDGQEDRFPDPVLIEAAIGCERCHGPGQKHVDRHSGQLARGADNIVNPARLPPDRADAVCYQCHLIGQMRILRYGRTYSDVRPGDRVDDVWTTLVAAESVRRDGKTRAVSQVEQMRASTCFMRSEGRLGCVSCHDPHGMPSNPASHYRQRCLACHAEKGCSLPAEKTEATAAQSCVDCHMPRLKAHDVAHTSQTDHRILRAPDPLSDDLPSSLEGGDLFLFDEEHTTMPKWEVERAKTLAAVLKLWDSKYASPSVAEGLVKALNRVAGVAPDDAPTWAALGTMAELQHDLKTARQHWEQVLAIHANDERALYSLTGICLQTGDYEAGLAYSDRLMKLNPYHPQGHLRRTRLLAAAGRPEAALAEAEKAVEVDPLDKSSRRVLLDFYRKAGNTEAANRQAEILKQISTRSLRSG